MKHLIFSYKMVLQDINRKRKVKTLPEAQKQLLNELEESVKQNIQLIETELNK